MKTPSRVNTLIAICLLSVSFAAQSAVDVYFSPKGGAKNAILSELSQAQSSVNIAMYSFSDSTLINKVKELSNSGIKVRLILNQANRDKAKSMSFEESGIDVRYVNLIMHHKFAIIDQVTLLTGSQNWSASAENSYDEDFLVFKNETEKLAAFQAEFTLMWNKSRDFMGPASDGVNLEEWEAPFASTFFTSQNFTPVFSRNTWSFKSNGELSEGVAGQAIIEAIHGAQSSIQIASAHFRRFDFYEAIKAALDRGVAVEIVLDGQEFDGKAPDEVSPEDTEHLDEVLGSLGASVKYKMYSRYWNHATAKQLHSKYMIVDEKNVLTGSFNWSENSELNTFENLISLGELEAPLYYENFEKISGYGGDDALAAHLARVKDARGQGPCVFEPMSLTAAEVLKLRKAYAPEACRH